MMHYHMVHQEWRCKDCGHVGLFINFQKVKDTIKSDHSVTFKIDTCCPECESGNIDKDFYKN